MNKKEFYKQLMSEYSFDADKIRENAKRGKSARQKLQPIYIGMSAAAAVCVVTVGTIAAVNLSRPGGVSLTDSGLTQLSASDRLSHALEQLEAERGSSESKDFLVTFSSPLSPAQAQSVLTAYTDGSIPVKQLYFADGTRISGGDNVGKIFTNGGSYQITGAAVYCSGSAAAQLQGDPAVFLVEAMEQSDFDNAAPLNIDEIATMEVTLPDVPVVSEPDNTVPQQPQTGAATAEAASEAQTDEGSDGTAEVISSTEEMDGTSEPAETEQATEEQPDEQPGIPVVGPTDPVDPADPASEQTATGTTTEPEVPTDATGGQTLPAGVTLPENVSGLNYNTYISADSAFFLNNDTFFVKNSDGVSLYRFNGDTETLICSEYISDARLVWAAEKGGRLIVSGASDYGTRGRMLLVDAESGCITDLHAEDAVMSGTLTSAAYNSDNELMALIVREEGRYYLCASSVDQSGNNDYIGTPFDSSDKLSIAAVKGDIVYITENSGGKTKLLAVNVFTEDVRTVHTFDSTVEMSRNLASTHAVFTPESGSAIGFTEIFDPETEKLIQLNGSDSSVTFGASRHSFLYGGNCYSISGGSISANAGTSVLAAIEYRKSFSESYAATVSGGTARITDSAYTALNKDSFLTYTTISGNASAELREAMNGAIGVNNALALKVCATSGITKTQILLDCINLYYSPAAAQKLISRCEIDALGALRYSSGGLTAISADETELVITSQNSTSASGVLYVKAGTFGGKTAYRSVNVSFLLDNGTWKLDTVL